MMGKVRLNSHDYPLNKVFLVVSMIVWPWRAHYNEQTPALPHG